jgi:splicing factor 45
MPCGLGARFPHQMPTEAIGGEAQEIRLPVPRPSTGEEAYLRRLAMSRGIAPPAPAPAPVPVQQELAPPVSSTLNIPEFAAATMTSTSVQTTTQSFQPPQDTDMGAPSPVALSPDPEPQHELLPEPIPILPLVSQAVPAQALPSPTQLTMEEKLRTAAAIAARLSALVKSTPSEPSTTATEVPPTPPGPTTT